jgi:hypothetical protein
VVARTIISGKPALAPCATERSVSALDGGEYNHGDEALYCIVMHKGLSKLSARRLGDFP